MEKNNLETLKNFVSKTRICSCKDLYESKMPKKKDDQLKPHDDIEVFLGGTCSDSKWREELIPKLKINAFNPVVEDWDEEAQKREIEKRETCDFVLYVITPKMKGVYSIAEVVDDSNKRPEKTLFCVIKEDGEEKFDKAQIKSLNQVKKMVEGNGANVFETLNEISDFLNNFAKSK